MSLPIPCLTKVTAVVGFISLIHFGSFAQTKWPYGKSAVNLWWSIGGVNWIFKNKDLDNLWESNGHYSFQRDLDYCPMTTILTVKVIPGLNIGGFYYSDWYGLKYRDKDVIETTTSGYWAYDGYYGAWNYYPPNTSSKSYYSEIRLSSRAVGGVLQLISESDDGINFGIELGAGKSNIDGYFYFNTSEPDKEEFISGSAPYYSITLFGGSVEPFTKKSDKRHFYIGMYTRFQFCKVKNLTNTRTNALLTDPEGKTIVANFSSWDVFGIRLGLTF